MEQSWGQGLGSSSGSIQILSLSSSGDQWAYEWILNPWISFKLDSPVSSVQFSSSVASDPVTPWTAACQASLSIINSLPEFTQTHVHWVGDAIQLSHPLLSPSFPAFNLFQHQSFPRSQFLASGGQSIGVSASASVLPMNIQDWFPLEWTGLISWKSKGLSRVFSNTTVQKHQFFSGSAFFIVQLSHPYMTTGKTIALTRWTFVGKVMSLPFNMLSTLVITFLPRSKSL